MVLDRHLESISEVSDDFGRTTTMKSDSDGNGTGTVKVDAVRIASDCVLFHAGDPPPTPNNLPLLLATALRDWLAANSACRVRDTLGIVVDGNTVALHVWFDERPAPEAT